MALGPQLRQKPRPSASVFVYWVPRAMFFTRHGHWSPTVPVSVWLPEPARDRGSKQETLNDDFYHTTSRSAAIFGIQTVLSYLVLALNLWIGLYSMKRSSGVWSFGDVSATYRRSFGNHTLAGALCSGNILPEPTLVSQQFRCFTGHSLTMFQYLAVHFNWYIVWHILTSMSSCK